MRNKILVAVAAAAVAAAAGLVAATGTASAGGSAATTEPAVLGDASMHAKTTTIGGASVLPTDRTVAHFFATANNPDDGVTYGYNMVGANPFSCGGSACSTTVPVDIVPLIINVGGLTFDGTDVLNAVLASPQFADDDYTSTTRSTAAPTGFTAGGPLSSGNTNVQLQDATMRSQFNRTGATPTT